MKLDRQGTASGRPAALGLGAASAIALLLAALTVAPARAGILQRDALWPAGVSLRVCFFPEIPLAARGQIVEIVSRWNQPGLIEFDFGSDVPPSCDGGQPSEIRVGSYPSGSSGSYVGTQALYTPQHVPTLLLGEYLFRGSPQEAAVVGDESHFEGVVLHEFGHALGFLHESSHPGMGCLYATDPASRQHFLEEFEAVTHWPKEVVEHHLTAVEDLESHVLTDYDPDSVMHFFTADRIPGISSSLPGCFPETRPAKLSTLDVEALQLAYGDTTGTLPSLRIPAIRNVLYRESVLSPWTFLPLDSLDRKGAESDIQLVSGITREWLASVDEGSLDAELRPVFLRLRDSEEVQAPPLKVTPDPVYYLLRAAALLESAESSVSGSWRRALKAAAGLEDPFGQYLLGLSYEIGLGGRDDSGFAMESYRKAAARDSSLAAVRLGDLSADYETAMTWYEKAAENGSADAGYSLAVLYDQGLGGVPQDFEKAAVAAKSAAESGIPHAQLLFGLLLTDGLGVDRDMRKAVTWFESAAAGGLADASMTLGSLRAGTIAGLQGVPQDFEAALAAYLKAAELGHWTAPLRAAELYEGIPRRIEPDLEKARRWYKIAAEKRNFEALLRLGELYLEEGGGQDAIQAFLWLDLATLYARGDDRRKASELRARAGESLEPLDWAVAHQTAANWVTAFEQGSSTLELLSSRPDSRGVSPPPLMQRKKTGSGVFISSHHVLTNYHVISGCSTLKGRINGDTFTLEPFGHAAPGNDVAILKADSQRAAYARLRSGKIEVGQLIGVAGFPAPEEHGLSSESSPGFVYKSSEVTSRSGVNRDYTRFQFKDPVSPGHSGGPILDRSARLAGLVVARNQESEIYYGIKGFLLRELLEDYGVDFLAQDLEGPVGDETTWRMELKEHAKDFTVFIDCLVEKATF